MPKGEIGSGWFVSGLQYAFYNLGIVPALLYTVRNAESRKEAVTCGVLSGAIGVIPAVLLLLAWPATSPRQWPPRSLSRCCSACWT